MDIEIQKFDDIVEVKPMGELDTYTADAFSEKMSTIIDAGTVKLILNLEEIRYVSSLGIGEIIQSWDRVRQRGGVLKFAGMSDSVYKVFKLVGLTSRFEIFETMADARESFA